MPGTRSSLTCAKVVLFVNRLHQSEVLTFSALRTYRPEGANGKLVVADCFADRKAGHLHAGRAVHACKA